MNKKVVTSVVVAALLVGCASKEDIEVSESPDLVIPEGFDELTGEDSFQVPEGNREILADVPQPPITVTPKASGTEGNQDPLKELARDGNGIMHIYTDQSFDVTWEATLVAIERSQYSVVDLDRTKRFIFLNVGEDGNEISKPSRSKKESLRIYLLDTGLRTDISIQKNETELASADISEKILTELEPLLDL